MKSKKLLLLSAISMIALASCGGSRRIDMSTWEFAPADATNIKVGILQPVEHGALTAARQGFVKAFQDANVTVTVDYQNAGSSSSDLNTLAKNLVANNDLTLGIGTGASVALQSASIYSGKTNPIFFTAVTDATGAGLVDSDDNPGQNITGSSDINPVADQIALVKRCIPGATKLGVMYTQSEQNSKVQADLAKAKAEEEGLSVTIATCNDASDIASVAQQICSSGIDALFVPTDNNLAAHMDSIKSALDANHVLCITGEGDSCKAGGHITLSIDYELLGYKAGLLAIKVVKGEAKPCDLPVFKFAGAECELQICSANLADAQITLPQEVVNEAKDLQK